VPFIVRDTVAFLLQCQASTQIADSSGSYPLHLAAWKGDLDIVKLLVERGPSRANVNQQVKYLYDCWVCEQLIICRVTVMIQHYI